MKQDKFAQIAYMDVDIPDGGALTYQLLQIAQYTVNTPKLGLILHRWEVDFSDWYAHANSKGAGAHDCSVALTISNLMASIHYRYPEVLQVLDQTLAYATAVGKDWINMIQRLDWTSLPGGGILIPADRLYLAAQCDDVDAEVTITSRLWYTVTELTAQDYLELVEQRTILQPTP